ncbi:MAG: hypothetical protein AAF828_04005 [Bacteroidota bacterium]
MTKHILFFGLFFLVVSSLFAQNFSGIFQESEAKLTYRQQTGWESFLADHQVQVAAGNRLLDIESTRVEGDERTYYAIYTESAKKDSVGIAMGWKEFVRLKRLMRDKEYVMIDVHAFALNEVDRQYIGVWVEGDTDHKIRRVKSKASIAKEIKALGRRRFQIKRVHVIDTPHGVPEYIALFHYSPAREYNFLHYSSDLPAFMKDLDERRMSDVRLIDYASFIENGEQVYLGIYQTGRYGYRFIRQADKAELDQSGRELKEMKGFSLVNMNIY